MFSPVAQINRGENQVFMPVGLSSAAGPGLSGPIINGFEFSERVLIVDQSRLVRSVFANALERKYECVCADSAHWANAYLTVYDFDLMIIDIDIPFGGQLLQKIIEEYPETDVVIVSATDRPKRVVDIIRDRSIEYLTKPCDITDLERAVACAIERRSHVKHATAWH